MEKLAGALERVNSVIGNTLCWAALLMLLLRCPLQAAVPRLATPAEASLPREAKGP